MLAALKKRKVLVIGTALLAAAAITWATANLEAQADKTTVATANTQAQFVIKSLDLTGKNSIAKTAVTKKVPQANVDWNKWGDYSKKLKAATDKYQSLAEKAKAEAANGPVSAATKSAGLDAANSVKSIAYEFADFQEKGNCLKYAKQNRALGDALLANANVLFKDLDADAISAASDAQGALADARKDLYADVKDTMSDSDKQFLKSDTLPKLQAISTEVKDLMTSVTTLLSNIKDQVTSGGIGGLTSCASSAASSDNPAAALLKPVSGLLDMVKSLGTNVADTISDISGL